MVVRSGDPELAPGTCPEIRPEPREPAERLRFFYKGLSAARSFQILLTAF